MVSQFITVPQIISGDGALESEETKKLLSGMGRKALIVTGPVMIKLGNVSKLTSVLNSIGIEYAVFSELPGEPDDLMIEAGKSLYLDNGCDFLIALGGGTPLDAMKAIGVLAVNKEAKITDYYGKVIDANMPPMLAIPTTAGTGSEATQFTIITDSQKNIKMLLKGKCLMPDAAVIDPQFTLTQPPKITAATGLDALCHCVEAYTSKKSTTFTDTFAASAVSRIFKNLLTCYEDGTNTLARTEMAIASLEAGIAFNNSSVTIIHGMSRPIGALFHVTHGVSNAMLMKECLSFALSGAYDRFGNLGRLIGAADSADDDKLAAEKFLEAMVNLVSKLEIPTLEEYGVDKEAFMEAIDKMSKDALDSGSPENTRREVGLEDIKMIYKRLW